VAARRKRPPRPPRYRVVAYELSGEQARLVMDATGAGFVAATGTIAQGRMRAQVGSAGPPGLQAHIALLIANEREQTYRQPPGRRLPR